MAQHTKAVRKNNFSNGAGAITDRTLEKQAFLIIPEGVAEVIFAHRLKRGWPTGDADVHDGCEGRELKQECVLVRQERGE